jgi:hypothetical protein
MIHLKYLTELGDVLGKLPMVHHDEAAWVFCPAVSTQVRNYKAIGLKGRKMASPDRCTSASEVMKQNKWRALRIWITLDTYSHVTPAMHASAAAKMESFMA